MKRKELKKMDLKNEFEKESKKVRLGCWILEEDNKWIIDKKKLINKIIEEIYKRK